MPSHLSESQDIYVCLKKEKKRYSQSDPLELGLYFYGVRYIPNNMSLQIHTRINSVVVNSRPLQTGT